MTVTINGSGTMTGLAVGGLNDNIITPAELSTGAPSWDSSGNLSFNSGYGSAAKAFGCRAWVNFNGTGTVAIRASGNVSSITDINTGYFRVNFTTAMPDDKYSVNNTCDDGAYGAICATATLRQNVAPTTTYVDVSTSNTSLGRTSADFLYNSVAIFR